MSLNGEELSARFRPGMTGPPVSMAEDSSSLVLVSGRPRLSDANRVLTSADVLTGYEEVGPRLAAQLRGDFAIVIWSQSAKRLWVARDPLGLHALFYRVEDKEIRVSPSPEVIADRRGLRSFDALSIASWIVAAEMPEARTFYAQVFRFPNAATLEWSPEGGLRFNRYWDPLRECSLSDASDSEIQTAVRGALSRSVARAIDKEPASIFLSGGIDSALIAALAVEHCRTNGIPVPDAYHLRFPWREHDESSVSSALAQQLGLNHHVSTLKDASDGNVVKAGLSTGSQLWHPLYNPWWGAYSRLAADSARAGRPVILTGEGGNQAFDVPWDWTADLIRHGRISSALSFWRNQRAYVGGFQLKAMLWQHGMLPVLRATTVRALAAVSPTILDAARESRSRKRLPTWLPADETLRSGLVASWRSTAPGANLPWLERAWAGRFRGSHLSMLFEQKFAEYSRIGAWVESPFFDEETFSIASRSSPEQLLTGDRAKGIEYALLEGSFSTSVLDTLVSPAPSTYFAKLVMSDVAPALRNPSSVGKLERLGIVTRPGLDVALEDLAKEPGPYYPVSSYLWRISAAEAWLEART